MYWLGVYIMIDLICIGLHELRGTRSENYKMKNSFPQWDSNSRPLAKEAAIFSSMPRYLILNGRLKVNRVLPVLLCIYIYLYHVKYLPTVYIKLS